MTRYRPSPAAAQAITTYAKTRAEGKRPHPRARDLCKRFGFSETTLRKIVREMRA